jgi:adenine phosphoribosyltransferase
VAYHMAAGFVPIRKRGKLPWKTEDQTYELEYGQETIEIHADAIASGERVAIVDDVLATGGTASAAARLVERLGGTVVSMAFLIELAFLKGREKLEGYDIVSLLQY